MGTVWKTVGIKAAGVGVSLAVLSGGYWGGVALFGGDTETSERSDVFTVTTPTETTTPAAPTTEAPVPVVEPVPVVTEPAPAPPPEAVPAPSLPTDGSLPEGWLPPAQPGGPPTAPMPPAYTPPCMPGEASERCAPVGG